jgi:hypothetical protein
MSDPGEADLLVKARSALLDALDALSEQLDALVLIGAQAIYLHTGAAPVALAETTKDSDIAIDPRALIEEPLIESAMKQAGFFQDLMHPQPGSWLSAHGIPVDLMVPEALSAEGGRRGARIPPHSKHATRVARGLEAAVVDHQQMLVKALDPNDHRATEINVAGPAALLVAKLHKLGERQESAHRLLDKDAHDIYRLLVAVETRDLGDAIKRLQTETMASEITNEAMAFLEDLFARGPEALCCTMAGRAEELVGDPAVVSAAVATLASDLLTEIRA